MDLDALEDGARAPGGVGTVVATARHDRARRRRPAARDRGAGAAHGVRVHVDAAYGGFFALLADDAADGVAGAPFAAVADADSIVVDPHKHGLQPYGCGACCSPTRRSGGSTGHDSPYTYFTSDDLHLGEIRLECSRAGAAAAALWLTLQVLPLTPDGLGAVLRPAARARCDWHGLLERVALRCARTSHPSSTSSRTSHAARR